VAWLKQHWDEYRGKWIAVRHGELLAAADSLDEIVDQVGELKNSKIMVTKLW
jgi:hypothetical protein